NPGPMTGPGTNTYLVGDATAVAVIDPGVDDPAHLDAIEAQAPGPIRDILITHKHPDHTGGAAALSARTGAPVRAHATRLTDVYDPAFRADAAIATGEVIDCGGHALQAIHTPGHTSDHLCFLLQGSGLLFAGDTIMAGVTVVIIPPDGDMRAYFDTLARLRELGIRRIAPGHGHVLEDPDAEIDAITEHRRQREAQIRRMLADGPASVAELAARIYPDVPETLRGMAQSQLTAHLRKLAAEQQAQWLDDARWQLVTTGTRPPG